MQLILGNRPAGQSDCLQALALAEPEKMISAFVEEGSAIAQILTSLLERDQLNTVDPAYVKSILEAFPEDGWPSQEELVEPLSKRELEILQLIAEGLSNQEIADRLVVTLHTIKKHSSNIYSKLGVSSRTQAVAQARQLKLL
jgi:LuxR family maltose regulon positive regulatory protein